MPFPQMPNLKFGLEDRAQKAIQVFYASLLDRLWTRQTMSSLARYNHLSIKDKGDWAKLKRIGWQILKITPYVGKVLKFTNSDDTPWISKLTKGLKYFKMGLKASKTASEILDYWDDFKQLSKGIDSYMRKWIEGNEVDTKTVYKQFANIFIIYSPQLRMRVLASHLAAIFKRYSIRKLRNTGSIPSVFFNHNV